MKVLIAILCLFASPSLAHDPKFEGLLDQFESGHVVVTEKNCFESSQHFYCDLTLKNNHVVPVIGIHVYFLSAGQGRLHLSPSFVDNDVFPPRRSRLSRIRENTILNVRSVGSFRGRIHQRSLRTWQAWEDALGSHPRIEVYYVTAD